MTQEVSTQKNQAPVAQNESPHDIRSMINHFWNMIDFPQATNFSDISPKIEVRENKNDVRVSAEVPGIAPENLEVEISADGYLTLSGEKRQENAQAGRGSYFSEISYGSFKRTIPLPWDLDFDKADAEYDNGTLMIEIPKSAQEQTKKKKLNVSKKKKKSEE